LDIAKHSGIARQALNSRQQGLHSCWSSRLEHPAGRDDISTITGDFLLTSENLAASFRLEVPLLRGHCEYD